MQECAPDTSAVAQLYYSADAAGNMAEKSDDGLSAAESSPPFTEMSYKLCDNCGNDTVPSVSTHSGSSDVLHCHVDDQVNSVDPQILSTMSSIMNNSVSQEVSQTCEVPDAKSVSVELQQKIINQIEDCNCIQFF